VLYPFRYRHELTGKWVKARYVAEVREIRARYKEWEIIGPPEIRGASHSLRGFRKPVLGVRPNRKLLILLASPRGF